MDEEKETVLSYAQQNRREFEKIVRNGIENPDCAIEDTTYEYLSNCYPLDEIAEEFRDYFEISRYRVLLRLDRLLFEMHMSKIGAYVEYKFSDTSLRPDPIRDEFVLINKPEQP